MPKKNKGGINNTRADKKLARKCPILRMQLRYALETELYAVVKSASGDRRFIVETLNGDQRCASARGTIAQQGRIKAGDWVLIEPLSANENGAYTITFKYTQEQYKCLDKEGILVKNVNPTKKEEVSELDAGDAHDDDGFMFEGEKPKDDGDMGIIEEMFGDNPEKFIDDI